MAVATEKFIARVTLTDKDEKDQRGRVKVVCPDLTGDPEAELPDWIEPVFDWGWFYIPDIDEHVEIEVVTASSDDEVSGQALIYDPLIHWRGKRFYHEREEFSTLIHDAFKTNYGKRRGFATPAGHVFLFDDTEGKERFQISLNLDGTFASVAIDESGILLLGEGADTPVVRGSNWKSWAEVHTHPTGTGPSGPPTQPIPATVLSADVKTK